MKVRYTLINSFYIPEYYVPKDNSWKRFYQKDVVGELRRIAVELGDLCTSREDGQWYFRDSESVFYNKEIYCMAFLGAAKSYFEGLEPKTREFDENTDNRTSSSGTRSAGAL